MTRWYGLDGPMLDEVSAAIAGWERMGRPSDEALTLLADTGQAMAELEALCRDGDRVWEVGSEGDAIYALVWSEGSGEVIARISGQTITEAVRALLARLEQ